MIEAPNRTILWAKVFVDELARGGLEAVCIAPGSRSTPLVVAFAEHPDIRVYTHIDERGAAFFALGLALASNKPVAVLCSSGTATANFFPAVIEARYSGVPLLVLTADRPHELRGSGANQTIDQIKLYGDHALWSVEVALPEAEPPGLAVRNLRGLAARALATANGTPRGPVHLNFPFRKPLEPIPVESDLHQIADERPDGTPFTRILRGALTPTAEQVEAVGRLLASSGRRMIVCGPRTQGGDFAASVARLTHHSGAALVADALSNVRYGAAGAQALSGYGVFLKTPHPSPPSPTQAGRGGEKTNGWEPPEVVLWFGGAVTSQALDDYLNNPSVRLVRIGGDGLWSDPNHRAELVIEADAALFCNALVEWFKSNSVTPLDSGWTRALYEADAAVRTVVTAETGAYFDGLVLRDTAASLPDDGALFVGNSLPVRNLDLYALADDARLRIFCNRGASGIDGTISSALGAAAGQPDQPLVLVCGDLTFYHDLNGLLAAQRNGLRAVFIVVNNNGGGIFRMLPIAQFEPPYTELFETPPDLNFQHAAALFGMSYADAQDGETFRAALDAALSRWQAGVSTVIEVRTDIGQDQARRKEITAAVAQRLSTI
jgi:2-succinyl-5-enolpyruvyl-6-hydroxy-3-cyclohexene-1-carboxylate synthase